MAEGKYHCDKCSRDFDTEEGFNQHNRDKHGIGKEKKHEKIAKSIDERDKAIDKAVKKKKTMKILKYTIPIILIIAVIGAAVVYLPKNNNDNVGLGAYGSAHIHADLAVYINGTQLSFNDNRYFAGDLRDKYAHLLSPYDSLIHIRATGITIGYFMKSIDIPFNSTCITDKNGERLCNDDTNTLKFYVKGEENPAYDKYIIKDQDKILISYGPAGEDIQEQLASITNLSEAAAKGLIDE